MQLTQSGVTEGNLILSLTGCVTLGTVYEVFLYLQMVIWVLSLLCHEAQH